MAAFRPTTTSTRVHRLLTTRKPANTLQCAGITRHGARCGRRVTASNLAGQPGKTNLANYCKTHLRINLNKAAGSNLRPTTKKGPYKGPSSYLIRTSCSSYP